jgi:hypothetical protein
MIACPGIKDVLNPKLPMVAMPSVAAIATAASVKPTSKARLRNTAWDDRSADIANNKSPSAQGFLIFEILQTKPSNKLYGRAPAMLN